MKRWTEIDIATFLAREEALCTTGEIARALGRSAPSVNSIRRKVKRLRELGAKPRDLQDLLGVSERFVQRHDLAMIRRRAAIQLDPVRSHYRRGRLTGLPGLIRAHVRGAIA